VLNGIYPTRRVTIGIKNFKLKIKLIKKVSKTRFSQPRNKEKG